MSELDQSIEIVDSESPQEEEAERLQVGMLEATG